MSDSAQIIVDIEVDAERAPALAGMVRAWLVSEEIVEREQSDSVLSSTGGHRPGRCCRTAIKTEDNQFLRLQTNGVEIVVGRRVFDAGGNGIELSCGSCRHDFEPGEPWMDAVSAWWVGDDRAGFACPSCGQKTLLTEWRGPWPWGFGNLAVIFWNWPPLSDGFIQVLSQQLGHRTVMVWRRI